MKIAMSSTRQPSQSVFRRISTRDSDLKTGSYIGTFYIGVADQFDDERRLVRETRARPTRPWQPFIISPIWAACYGVALATGRQTRLLPSSVPRQLLALSPTRPNAVVRVSFL